MKIYHMSTLVIDNLAINYFYTKLKSDINGNPRYKVFVIDPDGSAIYENIAKTYNISDWVRGFIERGSEQ